MSYVKTLLCNGVEASRSFPVVSDSYLIPYPPGVPLVVPGDLITREFLNQVYHLKETGVEVFVISE
jgi:lysine decarboxylase